MLKHCVFLNLKSSAEMAAVREALMLLSGLVGEVAGMIDFVEGPNRDFEQRSEGYGHGFIVTFADRPAHLAYEAHPDHVRAGAMLVEACREGVEGIFVADLEVA
ncbi:Dabb family protein [uncultured Devosia sp.]|uniref:Dabb family protein n=1 Tax=uncultured Devosia sp. TaxID=211434 RepID=UPI0026197BF2|nr:Dabb family protein [uncultured Devosia sp.]